MMACLGGLADANETMGVVGCALANGSTGEWTVLTLAMLAVFGVFALARGGEFDIRDI